MEYKVILSHSTSELNKQVNELIKEGWSPVGSHQSNIRHVQNRFRGDQHVDSLHDIEYSQTMIKKESDEK